MADSRDEVYETTYHRLLEAIGDAIRSLHDEPGAARGFQDVLVAAHATLAQEVGRIEKLIEKGAELQGKPCPDLVKARRERMARGRGIALSVMTVKDEPS